MILVLFDCDGTIVDSQHIIVAAMTDAFTSVGLEAPARPDILSIVGLSLVPAVSRLLPAGAETALAEDLADRYKSAFRDLRLDPRNHEPLYPGARDVIEELARRDDVILGVATGKSRRGVDALFMREGLADLFTTIQTADDHPSKPHPSMIRQALAETSVAPSRAVMIGDTTFDMEMALAAGVVPLGVSWGYHDVDMLRSCGAASIAEDYRDVPSLIEKHVGGAAAAPRGRTGLADGTSSV